MDATQHRGLAPPKPATQAQAALMRRQHRVFTPRRDEAHEPPPHGFDVPELRGRAKQSKLPTGARMPGFIQIEDQRHDPLILSAQLIHVRRIARAGRVPGIVHLQLLEPEKSVAIQLQPQLIQIACQRALLREQRFGQPACQIAANLFAPPGLEAGADARGGEFTKAPAPRCARDQPADSSRRNEPVLNTEAVGKQRVPQCGRTRARPGPRAQRAARWRFGGLFPAGLPADLLAARRLDLAADLPADFPA